MVVLDEATASVDLQTDAVLQGALRTYFASSTVLTVAHRLNTIIDYDRVLVMDNGRVAEFDRPSALLDNPQSLFSVLVDETGPSNAAYLRSLVNSSKEDM
jgi:ABC-type multidrug transport system fused ATPase/permease subunit